MIRRFGAKLQRLRRAHQLIPRPQDKDGCGANSLIGSGLPNTYWTKSLATLYSKMPTGMAER